MHPKLEQQASPRLRAVRLVLVLLLGLLFTTSEGWAQQGCGSLEGGFGPFDYNDPAARQKHLATVERRHFTDRVRSLQGGQSARLAADISYTLNWFPNHPLALDAMARLAVQRGTSKPEHSEWSVDCWFQRAIRFRPEDGMVRLVQGLYHFRVGELDKAEAALEKAAELAPNNYQVHYNLGLLLARQERYEEAIPHARRAYELGHPLPGLRRILSQNGYSLGE